MEYKVRFPKARHNLLGYNTGATFFSSVFKIQFMTKEDGILIKKMVESMIKNSECDLYYSERSVYSRMNNKVYTFEEVRSPRLYKLIEAIVFQFRSSIGWNHVSCHFDECPGESVSNKPDIIGRFKHAEIEQEIFKISVNIRNVASYNGATSFSADLLTCKSEDSEVKSMLLTAVDAFDQFDLLNSCTIGEVKYIKQHTEWVAPIHSSVIKELYDKFIAAYPGKVKLFKAPFSTELFSQFVDVVGYIYVPTTKNRK
jgi:hypothetical protein